MNDNGLLSENKNSIIMDGKHDGNHNAETVSDVEDKTLLCGWRTWRPELLQRFANPKWFIIFISMFSLAQGILVMGITSVSLPDIEKEFGFSSKESGLILASNDISALVLVPIVSFFGAQGHKPKWIGFGAIITGLGAMLFSLPKAMIGKYVPLNIGQGALNKGICQFSNATVTPPCILNSQSSSSVSLMVLSIAQMLMGAGTAPLFTLGPAYIDENVNPKVSPIYLGTWFATTFLGPGLGYVIGGSFLRKFTNIELPEGMKLTPEDPRWIGAWWLGYFLLSWIPLFCGALLLAFPKDMPHFKQKRYAAIKGGDLPTADATIGKGWRDLLHATLQLFKNVTYMCATLALTARAMFGVAIGSFFAKILILKFGGTTSIVGFTTGAVMIPGMFVGILAGSFMMKKLKLKDSARTACKICFILSCITCFSSVIWLIPGCHDTIIAGATTPYHGSQSIGSLHSHCNINCGCSRGSYLPTCGSDGKTYFSPCHAGCSSQIGRKTFANCTCISLRQPEKRHTSLHGKEPFSNNTDPFNQIMHTKEYYQPSYTGNKEPNASQPHQLLSGSAKYGKCDRGCKNMILFLIIVACVMSISFFGAVPHKMIPLRCVPDNQRSYALGLQFLLMRSISFIPGPVIFGAIVDSQCVLWAENECGERGNCLDYRVDKLSFNVLIFGVVTSVTGTILYGLAWYFYLPAPTMNEDDVQMSRKDKNVLLADAAAQLSEDDAISLHSVGKLAVL